MANSADLLNSRVWHSSSYEVIEHVATRDQPSSIKFAAHFDASIYPGNYSIVDKIGNLTLLSGPVNSSIYSECPDGHPNSPTCGHLKLPHPERGVTMG